MKYDIIRFYDNKGNPRYPVGRADALWREDGVKTLENEFVDLYNRFDNVITNVTTNDEIVDARYDELNNITYTTLYNRLKGMQDEYKAIETQALTRKFKPMFTAYMWTQNTADASGNRTVSISTSKIDGWMNNIKACGFDGLEFCMHVGYNSITNDLYYMTNLDTLEYILNSGIVEIKLIKFHQEFKLDCIQSMGLENFKTRYKAMIVEVANMCKNYGIEYFVVLNEWQHFWVKDAFPNHTYLPNDFVDYTIELIQAVQSYGYKTGVSTAGCNIDGWSSCWTVDKSVYDVVDCFFTNGYPPVGNRREKTTKEDCIRSMENYNIWMFKRWMKMNYPTKPHFHTEIGCTDAWESLYAPADSTLVNGDKSGDIYKIYLTALFEVFKDSDLIGMNWWYYDTLGKYADIVTPIISEYCGKGVR